MKDTKQDLTTIETQLINVINNFIEWDTNTRFNKETRRKAVKYIKDVSEKGFPQYNKWFETKKEDVIKFIDCNYCEDTNCNNGECVEPIND